MLSYIIQRVSNSFVYANKPIPVNSSNGDIVKYFTKHNDSENILHLLQDDTREFACKYADYKMIDELSKTNTFSTRQYNALGMYLSTRAFYSSEMNVVYQCYKHTGNYSCAQRIIDSERCYTFQDPIIPVTVERLCDLVPQPTEAEFLYLYNLLTYDEQLQVINNIDLSDLIRSWSLKVLELILPRATHKDRYSVAYTYLHGEPLPFTETALLPSEYFIARKFTDWTGDLIDTQDDLLDCILNKFGTDKDRAIIQEMHEKRGN